MKKLFITSILCLTVLTSRAWASEDTDGSTAPAFTAETGLFGLCAAQKEISYTDAYDLQCRSITYEEGDGNPIIVFNRKVEESIRYFQTAGRKYIVHGLERSGLYGAMVEDVLIGMGLPTDLLYIALIESGFNPNVRSRAGAVGVWQFIPSTAKYYGLKVDWWIDERKNTEKATVAAASYFQTLYDIFNSWHLAAAGYNAGEGKILRAMKKYKTEDFWELSGHKKPLKKETKDYVPKFIAALLIAKDPEKYGFTEITYKEPLTYDKISVPSATDIKVIAGACEVTVEEIKTLNPELRRWFTPPDYPGYELKVPEGKGGFCNEKVSSIPPGERLKFLTHKVKNGETLSHIAKKYSTDVDPIMRLNDIKNKRGLRAGAVIVVPVRPKDETRAYAGKSKPGVYMVRKGDTLHEISRRFGVEVDKLLEWNNLDTDSARGLMPGQTLYLKEASLDTRNSVKN